MASNGGCHMVYSIENLQSKIICTAQSLSKKIVEIQDLVPLELQYSHSQAQHRVVA